MELRHLLTIDVAVQPVVDLDAFPLGGRRFVGFDGGTFTGRDGLRGTIAPGGIDWQLVRADGVIEIDAHYLLLTDEAEPVEVRSTGLRKVSDAVAILDARVLAGCLRAEPDVVAALARYEGVRLPATSAIVEANRGLGPEVPMQLVHERAPDGFDDIDAVISRAEIDEVTDAYRRTAGFALSALQNDPRSLIDQWATVSDPR